MKTWQYLIIGFLYGSFLDTIKVEVFSYQWWMWTTGGAVALVLLEELIEYFYKQHKRKVSSKQIN